MIGGIGLADIIAGVISLAWMKAAAAGAVAEKSSGVAAAGAGNWPVGERDEE